MTARKPTVLILVPKGVVPRQAEKFKAAGWDVTVREIGSVQGRSVAEIIIDDPLEWK